MEIGTENKENFLYSLNLYYHVHILLCRDKKNKWQFKEQHLHLFGSHSVNI